MKKVFLTASVMLMATTLTFAHAGFTRKERKESKMEKREARKESRKERRAENRVEVSDVTKNNFARDFPNATNTLFARTKQFDEVSFLSGKKHLKAYYDFNSDLVGTTQNKSFADLPASAQKEIRKY